MSSWGGAARRTAVAALLAAAAAFVATSCSSAPETTPPAPVSQSPVPSPGLAGFYGQQLEWRPCEGSFECAELVVPRDYDRPDGGETEIALLRVPGEKPLGPLVVNPGGPGGSGVEWAMFADQILAADVSGAYQVVGFDPRGVGRSTGVDCVSDRQLDRWIAQDGDPRTRAEEEALLTAAQRFAKRCGRTNGDWLAHIGTESVVADLDILRSALDAQRLNYLGFSYGTTIGALYADRFGPTTGRMVLDGALPPQLTGDEVGLGQARGFEDALRRYVEDCQRADDCPVAGGDVDAGVARIQRFLADLQDAPLPTESGRDLNQALAAGSILYHLYFPSMGDWDSLSEGLRDAFSGDGTTLLDFYDTRLERQAGGRYRNNSHEAFFAVSCIDRGERATADELRARADAWAQEAPTFGRYLAWSEAACIGWPEEPEGGPRQVTGSEAGPILVVGTRHDPATPLQWAQLLVDRMADAHLVIWESDGHTAFGNGSGCVDDAVGAYLLDGTLPAEDPLVCS